MMIKCTLPQKAINSIETYILSSFSPNIIEVYANEYREFVEKEKYWLVLLEDQLVSCDKDTYAVAQVANFESCMSQFFEIHPYDDGYIIYGEVDILRLSSNMEMLWDFSGRDIFVSQDSSPAFVMEENKIVLSDWLGWHYHLGYDGRLLKEYHD